MPDALRSRRVLKVKPIVIGAISFIKLLILKFEMKICEKKETVSEILNTIYSYFLV